MLFDVEDDCMTAVAFRKFDCGNAIDLPFCWGCAPDGTTYELSSSSGGIDPPGLGRLRRGGLLSTLKSGVNSFCGDGYPNSLISGKSSDMLWDGTTYDVGEL